MESERCPLCNTSTPQTFELRGFDEFVGRLNPTDRDVAEDQHVVQVQGDGDSGDEFQICLPSESVPHSKVDQ